jgi:uncharacterized protein
MQHSSTSIARSETEPIRQFVVKIASRCNLACPYCYEYFHGDHSWRAMPKLMEVELFGRIIDRIVEHAREHKLEKVLVSLHGGEPLLVGATRFADLMDCIASHRGLPHIDIGIQTNATLYNADFHEICTKHNVSVGVSIDGPKTVNDSRRPYHDGSGSTEAVERALQLLSGSPVFGGLLAVIPIAADPEAVFHYLAQWRPPILDFLLPHAHWNNPAPGHPSDIARGPESWASMPPQPYGRWMIKCFDLWWQSSALAPIAVRTFEEIIRRLAGREGVLETLGVEPVSLMTISTNGNYEGVDTLKSAYPGAQVLGRNVVDCTISDVALHESIRFRQRGLASLADECRSCPLVQVCGGGYLPHRFGRGSFLNPSVYCGDLALLIQHIRATMVAASQP